MQYVFKIEQAFRSLQGNPQQYNMLTRGLDELLAGIQEDNYFDPGDYLAMALPSTGKFLIFKILNGLITVFWYRLQSYIISYL